MYMLIMIITCYMYSQSSSNSEYKWHMHRHEHIFTSLSLSLPILTKTFQFECEFSLTLLLTSLEKINTHTDIWRHLSLSFSLLPYFYTMCYRRFKHVSAIEQGILNFHSQHQVTAILKSYQRSNKAFSTAAIKWLLSSALLCCGRLSKSASGNTRKLSALGRKEDWALVSDSALDTTEASQSGFMERATG